MRAVIRVAACAAALAVAAAVVPGIDLRAGPLPEKAATLVAVALIFGLVNAVLKPIAKSVGCMLYALTLGLLALVVNGLLLWLTGALAHALSLPFEVTGFAPAFFGAIVVGVVSWALNMLTRDRAG